METGCGVSQRSVLGPLLWDVIFDAVLRIPLPPRCLLVCYTDDTLVLLAGKTSLMGRASLAMAAVSRRMRPLELVLAPAKTKAVVFRLSSVVVL